MKKAISLVEVLVSIMLITTVIAAILQMKDNNLFYLDKFQNSSLNNSYLNFAVDSSSREEKRNKSIYLNSQVDFKDDAIRKELKKIKIFIKDTVLKDISIPKNDYIDSVGITQSQYSFIQNEKTITQKFYTFKLEQ